MPRAAAVAVLVVAMLPAVAQPYHVMPDVPTTVGPWTLLPWQVVRLQAGVWSPVLSLPEGTRIDALQRLPGERWLFAVAVPTRLGNTVFLPSDVVLFDGQGFTRFWEGAAAGVPPGAAIDALLVTDATGQVVVSFDVPLRLGGQAVEPADLTRWDGDGFQLFFDASEAQPPPSAGANVVAADQLGEALVLAFDAPTTLGAWTAQPGQLVAWDGQSWQLAGDDPAWPADKGIRGLAYPDGPGSVPMLHVDRASPDPETVVLSWMSSCSEGADDYAVYEGCLGDWYSHLPVTCSDAGADLEEAVRAAPGDRYFIVVPRNAWEEGSHGTDYRTGKFGERPPPAEKADRCAAVQGATSCF